jgi:hypothetical protein
MLIIKISMAFKSRKLAFVMLPFLSVPFIVGFLIYAVSHNTGKKDRKADTDIIN